MCFCMLVGGEMPRFHSGKFDLHWQKRRVEPVLGQRKISTDGPTRTRKLKEAFLVLGPEVLLHERAT